MWPTWGPTGTHRTQLGPMLAPWILLSGILHIHGDLVNFGRFSACGGSFTGPIGTITSPNYPDDVYPPNLDCEYHVEVESGKVRTFYNTYYNDVIMGAMESQVKRLFRRRSKKTPKLRVTGLCAGNSPVTGEFPAQRASKRKMFPFDDVIMNTRIRHTDDPLLCIIVVW